MNAKFTSGPWREDDGFILNEYGVVSQIFDAGDETQANAQLIIAAPGLYAALDDLIFDIDFEIEQRQHSGNDEDWADLKAKSDRAHAALRKARGE